MERVLREGKTLRLQFPAEDLGFRYDLGGHCNSNASTCSPGAIPVAEVIGKIFMLRCGSQADSHEL